MAVPKRVQAQADASDQIEAKIAAELAPPAPTSEVTDEKPTPTPAPAPSDTPPVTEDFRAKYLTLQGMYNAEVPRLHEQIKGLQAQITALTPKPDEPVETRKFDPLVTSQDTEAFGADLLDVVRRQAIDAARAEFAPELERLRAENAGLKGTVNTVAERVVTNDRNAYWAALDAAMPDWQTVNTDPAFKAWLDEVDPLSGLVRGTYIGDAYEKMDAGRTLALFAKFRETSGTAPQPKPATTELERQTAPETSRVASVDLANVTDDQIISVADIDVFWKAVRKGEYRGNEAEKLRIEASIDRAVAAGRVRT